jgi:hypothetical protein
MILYRVNSSRDDSFPLELPDRSRLILLSPGNVAQTVLDESERIVDPIHFKGRCTTRATSRNQGPPGLTLSD